jgi:hypothetical protein
MFKQRIIKLTGQLQRDTAKAAIDNAPDNIEVVLREPVKARSQSANDLMWAGPLKDIAEQAYVEGRQFIDKVWHEHFKALYLPEENDPYLFELVKHPESYKKWNTDPAGNLILVASTTDLTKYGFSQYLDQIHADGASMGVLFSERPR